MYKDLHIKRIAKEVISLKRAKIFSTLPVLFSLVIAITGIRLSLQKSFNFNSIILAVFGLLLFVYLKLVAQKRFYSVIFDTHKSKVTTREIRTLFAIILRIFLLFIPILFFLTLSFLLRVFNDFYPQDIPVLYLPQIINTIFILYIITFILSLKRYSLAMILKIKDNTKSTKRCIKESIKLMHCNKLRFLIRNLLFLPHLILIILTLGIYSLYIIPIRMTENLLLKEKIISSGGFL